MAIHTTKDIRASLDRALSLHHALAMEELERLATKILLSKNATRSFCMAMGEAFFMNKEGEPMWFSDHKYLHPVGDLIDELNRDLNLTGTPLKLTIDPATGAVQRATDW